MIARAEVSTTPSHSLALAALFVGGGLLAAMIVAHDYSFLYVVVLLQFACLAVPVWYRWSRGQLDYFEPLFLVMLIYFVYFGLGSLWAVGDPAQVAYDLYIVPYIPIAAFYCLLGMVALLIGYFGLTPSRPEPARPPEWPRGTAFLVLTALAGFLGHLAAVAVEQSFHLASRLLTSISPIAQLSPLFLYAWGLGWLLYYSGRSTRQQRMVLFGLLTPATLMIVYLTVSDKSLTMTLAGIPIMARWYGLRKIPWTTLVALLLILIFVVFPLYNTFRASDPHQNNVARLESTYHTISGWDSDRFMLRSFVLFKFRMALINSVAVVVRDVGRWEPYAMGKTIVIPTLANSVPRYLWPDKPIDSGGREFGRRFRVTNYWSRNTFIAATLPGELYWNFHVPGVVIGMGLFGYVMRWLYRRYGTGTQLDPARRAVHLAVVVQLVHLGSSIAIDANLLFRIVLMLAVLRWAGRHFGLLGPCCVDEGPPLVPQAATRQPSVQ